ncbi:hypothetical protein V8E36_005825 [Tilletia maclaganii]
MHGPSPTSLLLFCLLALLALFQSRSTSVSAAPTDSALERRAPVNGGLAAGLHLNAATFTSTIHSGAWLVEFYSPFCHHCQKFAPTWEDAAKMSAHLQDSSNFHMARVDCVAQADLCKDEKVQWLPTVRLYHDGKKQNEYKGDRSYADLTSYIKAKAADYRKIVAKKQGLA